jgi:hypothetical protein
VVRCKRERDYQPAGAYVNLFACSVGGSDKADTIARPQYPTRSLARPFSAQRE